jgi:thiol-disulfide isomerase/thioredoxin
VQDIIADLAIASHQLDAIISGPNDLFDPNTRATEAPKVIPVLKHVDSDFETLAQIQPQAADESLANHVQIQAMLDLYGDSATDAALRQSAAGTGPDSVTAQSSLILADWWGAKTDAASQKKVLDNLTTLAKAHPQDPSVTVATLAIVQSKSSATPDLLDGVRKVLSDDLKTPEAMAAAQQFAAQDKLESLVGKPLVLSGPQLGGKPFTTADWKGKVVLVDFWASWCGPCVESMPMTVKAYNDYHAKGLEVLGVSNDFSSDDLEKFLVAHPEMAWPQLFDADAAKNSQWNPIALNNGVMGIPTMFLIDKKGIVRSTDAELHLDDLIPQLLQEPAN